MPIRCRSLCMILLVALAGTTTACVQARKLTYVDMVSRMTDLEHLAALPSPGEGGAQCSSYDRASTYVAATNSYRAWDANADGGGYIRREGHEYVLAEMTGPGCVVRIWSAQPRAGHVKIYLDGQTTPAVDLPFSQYFDRTQAPFTYPGLVYQTPHRRGDGGYNCFVPIPYQKSCKIVAEPGWGSYYHFNYANYPAGTVVPTFRRELGTAERAELQRVDDFFTSSLGLDPKRGLPAATTLTINLILPPHSSRVQQLTGARAITSLKVDFPAMRRADQMVALRELALRISWDSETKASVWSPLGDFFGTGPGVNPYKSLPMGMNGNHSYSYWYMPFSNGAKVELTNDGPTTRRLTLRLAHVPLTLPAASLGRFHAKWHRDAFLPTEKGRAIDWTLLKTTGRGRYCGTLLNVWNPRAGWWGEGDEKWFVDGEKFPSTFGTGSEDYFGYAWCLPIYFARPYHSQSLTSPNNRGHISVNRWQIVDNVPFQTGFEGAIEKYFPNSQPTQYSAVAYWYLQPGGDDPYGQVPVGDRVNYYETPPVVAGAIECEKLPVVSKTEGKTFSQDMSMWEGKNHWSGDAQLWWADIHPGAELGLGFPVAKSGVYEVKAAMTKAADYGIVELLIDGQKAEGPFDLYTRNWVVPTGELSLGTFRLSAGQHLLKVKVTGKNPSSKGYLVGLDYLRLCPRTMGQ